MINITDTTTSISYFCRYDRINKYEILDHSSRIVESGTTTILAVNNKITHSGLTVSWVGNILYTYKSYYLSGSTYLLANQSLLKFETTDRTDDFITEESKNYFVTKQKANQVTGSTVVLIYYSRYNQIDRFEILDHNQRIIYSGSTTINGVNNKITHSNFNIYFDRDVYYTYKSYYQNKLANQSLLKFSSSDREDLFTNVNKEKSYFKAKQTVVIVIIDGGTACYVNSANPIDGGSACSVGTTIIKAQNACV